ncbi:MAG: hypothetical protein ABIH72_00010 [archaeon]
MKAWLKGGLIGLGIDIILVLFSWWPTFTNPETGWEATGFLLGITQSLAIIPIPLVSLIDKINYLLGLHVNVIVRELIPITIFGLVGYFLIGALIGFSISRTKKARQKP